jgi:hypothetical protein
MNPKHQKQIDAWLAEQEAKKLSDAVSYAMNPVAWHIEEKLNLPASSVTHSDCCYFVQRVGSEYLRKHLRGVGATIAARLVAEAKQHLAKP